MNIIDALLIWNEYTENYIGGHGELSAGAIVINELVTAYNALAPDWSEAPEWALWYAIDADKFSGWYETEPECATAQWIDYGKFELSVARQLPIGIDWRLCKWQRPIEA